MGRQNVPQGRCLSVEQLRFSGTDFEHFVFTVLFPPICFFGIAGNLLNLIVLLSREMRSSGNTLLAALAFCDIIFLLLIIPHGMANFDCIAMNYYFRHYYFAIKIYLIAFANWCSALAIWLVVAISIERVIAIRYPFRAQWSQKTVVFIISAIVIFTFLLTFYDYYAYVCVTQTICNGSQMIGRCHDVTQKRWLRNMTNPTPKFQQDYVRWSIMGNAVLAVILPIVLLIVSNIALIVSFKNRSKLIHKLLSDYSTKEKNEKVAGRIQLLQQKTERKIELTAIAIVACFIITKVPSAVLFTVNILWTKAFNRLSLSRYWYNAQIFASFLVVCGKTINFTLICLSSQNFRKKLLIMIKGRVRTSSGPSISVHRNYELLGLYRCRPRRHHYSV